MTDRSDADGVILFRGVPDVRRERTGWTCPRCGMVSHHPTDREQGYCGACHDWTGTAPGDTSHGEASHG